jgi:hypothetical protein
MSCGHIDEETCPCVGVNIQKPSQFEKRTRPLVTGRDKNYHLPKSQLLQQSHEIKQLMKLNQLSETNDDKICQCANTMKKNGAFYEFHLIEC